MDNIYVMYILFSEGYIQRYSPDSEVFFCPRQKNPEGRAVPEGRRPEGTALPEGIFLPRTKKIRGWGGYIVVYSPTRPHIYNKYTIFLSLFSNEFINTLLTSLWVIQQIRKFDQIRGLYMNLGISNVHYNVDEKQGPLYIALRTGHIYIYICPVHRAYILYMPCTEGYIRRYSPRRGAICGFYKSHIVVVFWSKMNILYMGYVSGIFIYIYRAYQVKSPPLLNPPPW